MQDNHVLYYYTSVETMRFILENANIYATNPKYMNDAEEYSNGLKELRYVINQEFGKNTELITEEDLEKSIRMEPDSYSISFSTKRDLLSQWLTYAKESGVSLEMDFSSPQKYRAYPEGSVVRKPVSNDGLCPRAVYYFTRKVMDAEKYDAVRNDIVNMIRDTTDPVTLQDIRSNAKGIWLNTTPYIKRYEFEAEGECRLVFNRPLLLEMFRIDYRNDRNVLKPYLDIECQKGWPITEIIIGPGFNQDAVYNSVKHFLNHRDLKIPMPGKRKFQKQCEKYLGISTAPEKVKKIWRTRKKAVMNPKNIKIIYKLFTDFVEEILSDDTIEKEYIENLKKRTFTRWGIVLSKSEIPYIY